MRLYLFTGRVAGLGLGLSFDLGRVLRPRRRTGIAGSGFVYVLRRADGEVKIGTTKNPPQRLRNLQTGSSLPLSFAYVAATGSAARIEQGAIELMRRFRLHGDWFEASAEMAASAVNAAAARLHAGLNPVDPVSAARTVPALGVFLTKEEKRRGTINFLIVVAAIAAGIFTAYESCVFIDRYADVTPAIQDVTRP